MDNHEDNTPRRQSLVQRLRSGNLGDIRVHDSAQAGELARRLGARAFTVGRDVYIRPELLNSGAEGEALLAHEMTHVMEQTGRPAAEMPLLRPNVSSASAQGAPVQRTFSGGGGGGGGGGGAASASAPASQTASEARAERAESGARGSSSPAPPQQEQSQAKPEHPDAEELAERVYQIMMRDLTLDRERGANIW